MGTAGADRGGRYGELAMTRTGCPIVGILCLALLFLPSGIAPCGAAESQPAAAPGQAVDPNAIPKAIEKAKAYLLAEQKDDGSWGPQGGFADAPTALASYGLLQADNYAGAPQMQKALEWLKAHGSKDIRCQALRCMVWGAVRKGFQYRPCLLADGRDVIRSIPSASPSPQAQGDDPNLAFWIVQGLLPLQARGEEVPLAAWRIVSSRWVAAQAADGGWGPAPGGPSGVPTTACGVLAIGAAYDELLGDQQTRVGRAPYPPPVVRGLAWLDKHLADCLARRLGGRDDLPACLFYYAQVARATGRWRFGEQYLYELGAAALLRTQRPDGSWAGQSPIVSTAHALSFLARPRGPFFPGHLEYAGDWNNRPRALAHLAVWLGAMF
jgi:hypothetical protein